MAKLRSFLFFASILFLLIIILLCIVFAVGLTENVPWEANLTAVRFSSVAFGDVDNDNRSDLVVTGCLNDGSQDCENGVIAKVYTNNGTGLNENITWGQNLTGIGHGSTAWGDINSDGNLDLVLSGCTNARDLSCNGQLLSKVYINNGTVLVENISWQQNLTGVWKGNLALTDIDNDGRLDLGLIGITSTSKIAKIYINNGSSLIENSNWQNNLTGLDDASLTFSDISNDGNIDIGITGEDTNSNKKTIIYINNGSSFIETPAWSQDLKQASQSGMIFGDYDNDGDMDSVLMGCCDFLYTYKNNGSTLEEFQEDTTDNGVLIGIFAGSIAFGDYDNDGFLDFVVIGREGTNGGRNRIYQNNKSGYFIANSTTGNELQSDNFQHGALAWDDLEQDGDLDLIVIGFNYNETILDKKIYISNSSYI
ncbi:MAG: VCBS repeat-containing protein [Candidatus Nanoarchaeia archaeon]